MAFRTKWLGLWNPPKGSKEYKRSGILTSEIFDSIPKYFRIVAKNNKDYVKGTNRPVMQFAFADTEKESLSSIISSENLCFMPFDGVDDYLDDVDDLKIEIVELRERNEELEEEKEELEEENARLKRKVEELEDRLVFDYGAIL